eukprot:CAMPEP_0194735046 /NCGR_PEP_ID=MMETSP0296-20130528/71988_1 /TAXON_ID=39354 /ORGANISM="Heterosigma akashiwo, Strain CCMP2393" /LENGTH=88 /DNA_ID=CAMNT_0039644077 /DNA_START=164 /DNA_END=427 /DNA_ORIENTATION=+
MYVCLQCRVVMPARVKPPPNAERVGCPPPDACQRRVVKRPQRHSHVQPVQVQSVLPPLSSGGTAILLGAGGGALEEEWQVVQPITVLR